jgi:hypothetical protein
MHRFSVAETPVVPVKKVLAISPCFPPANTPDMQRLRMALPYFGENGWEVTVATVDPAFYNEPLDDQLLGTVPEGTQVLRLPCWDERVCRRFGFGHLANRIVWPWRRAILRILQQSDFDLVFFSTTKMMVAVNAGYWHRKTGVPYVVDLQDPIYVPGGSYSRKNAPGGHWKYRLSNFFSRYVERSVFSCPSAVVATSAHYIEALRQRYAHLARVRMEALPFGVPEKDLELVDSLVPSNRLFDAKEGERVVFYAGRVGPDLHPALRALFQGAARLQSGQVGKPPGLRFVFVGTSYSPAGRGERQVAPLAEECGCGGVVTDEPDRRPYFEVLKATKEADCALVLGSREADYTASKALGTLAAAKTVLAIVHEKSLVYRIYRSHSKVMLCAFADTPEESRCVDELTRSLEKIRSGGAPGDDHFRIPPEYGARAMTKTLGEIFNSAVSGQEQVRHG